MQSKRVLKILCILLIVFIVSWFIADHFRTTQDTVNDVYLDDSECISINNTFSSLPGEDKKWRHVYFPGEQKNIIYSSETKRFRS